MIDLRADENGIVLPVRAQPGARANRVRGEYQGALKVAVTQIAEKGKANKAVADVLCRALGLSRSQVELLAGPTSQDKRFLVRGITLEELARRIAALEPADDGT